METIECKQIGEKYYKTKLDNGLEIIVFPKNNTQNKYVLWLTKYGSNTSSFIDPKTKKRIDVPEGVAHFLEHKMFEQKDGTNSLDTLTSIGVSANAYTCSTHTAYLFEGIDNFDPALKELMDYVQNPYFTPENVEKEKGIIGQEIGMYDDDTFWRTYFNMLNIMYINHPIKIDTAGTVESISKITDQTLYTCYNNFYSPNNMVMILVGDFDKNILEQIKQNITDDYSKRNNGDVVKIIPDEPDNVKDTIIEDKMELTIPMFMIGIKLIPNNKLKIEKSKDKIKREIAIKILNELLLGATSKLNERLYNEGYILDAIDSDFDYSDDFAYILYSSNSKDSKYVFEKIKEEIQKLKNEGINKEDFEIIKRKLYGNEVKGYDNVRDIARALAQSSVNDLDLFDYIDIIENITIDDITEVLNRDFNTDKMVISITNPK